MSIQDFTIEHHRAEFSEQELLEFKEIFYLTSSKKKFSSHKERDDFFFKWAGVYLKNFPEQIYLAKASHKIVGYTIGCLDTLQSFELLTKFNPSLELFKDLYDQSPAHIHINCHPNVQGYGLGSHLIEVYSSYLQSQAVREFHIITSPDARNISFYKKNGFVFEETRNWKGQALHFMSKRIEPLGSRL